MTTSHAGYSLEALLTCPQNLYWAWLKYQRYMQSVHTWIDDYRLSCFEANLQEELDAIAGQFKRLTYQTEPIRPLPLPLPSHADKNGKRAGLIYDISIRDQVAWIAFLNVIGPGLDGQMPPWSYGGRLHRSTWDERKNGTVITRNGGYRHSSGHLYRNSLAAWSLYQRHIFLTDRAMAGLLVPQDLEAPERSVLERERYVAGSQRLPYLQENYWPAGKNNNVYMAQISFKTCISRGSLAAVADNISAYSTEFQPQLHQLASQLLQFRIDRQCWKTNPLAGGGSGTKKNTLTTIPAGLAVSDFLQNIALMAVEQAITKRLIASKSVPAPDIREKTVAHFRFGVDHCFLSRDFSSLVDWVNEYQALLEDHGCGTTLNWKSIKPQSLSICQNHTIPSGIPHEESRRLATQDALLDNTNPLPVITRTLRMLTSIKNLNFDLLEQREKALYIDKMENLLLGRASGIADSYDFQIDSIARKLAWSVPQEVLGNQANLCPIERGLFETKKHEHSLCKRLQELRKDTEEALATRKSLQQLQQKIKGLEKEHQQLSSANTRKQHKRQMHIFLMLLKALRSHQEKLNLWVYLLEYCRFSGHTDLTLIHNELEQLSRRNPAGAGHIRALICRLMANQAVLCAVNMSQKDHLIYRRQAAYAYLQTLLRQPVTLPENVEPALYEQKALNLMQCGFGSALLYLQNAENELIMDRDFRSMQRLAAKCEAIDWFASPEKWAEKTSIPLSAWAWWAETRLNAPMGTGPGPIWNAVVSKLGIDEPCTCPLLFRYPHNVTRKVKTETIIKACLAKDAFTKKDRAGWLHELLQGTDPVQYKYRRGSAITPGEKKILRIMQKSSNDSWITLEKWACWSRQKYKENLYDPRVTEWTALELADQIAGKVKIFVQGDKNDEYPLHPLNILVPEKWTRERKTVLTWDYWRDQIREEPFLLQLRGADRVDDYRYRFTLSEFAQATPEIAMIRGFGLLLLGLVTHSFDWPAVWNVRGHEWQYFSLVRAGMRNIPFSSWTHAILEACLLPRQLETALTEPSLSAEYDDDTALDPPQIMNLTMFQSYVRKARQVLERYQLTLQHRIPRQLVPVQLEHFTRPDWTTEIGE